MPRNHGKRILSHANFAIASSSSRIAQDAPLLIELLRKKSLKLGGEPHEDIGPNQTILSGYTSLLV